MPITPFHFGPGAVIKAVAPRYFSLSIFCVAQFITDAEVVILILLDSQPIHRFFHTYVGAIFVAALSVIAGRPLGVFLKRIWNARLDKRLRPYLQLSLEIPFHAALSGALVGASSHVFLDSIMHPDMKPLVPVSQANPMLGVLSFYQLHVLCAVLGIIGAGIYSYRSCGGRA